MHCRAGGIVLYRLDYRVPDLAPTAGAANTTVLPKENYQAAVIKHSKCFPMCKQVYFAAREREIPCRGRERAAPCFKGGLLQ